jgi:hypothetical protein
MMNMTVLSARSLREFEANLLETVVQAGTRIFFAHIFFLKKTVQLSLDVACQ